LTIFNKLFRPKIERYIPSAEECDDQAVLIYLEGEDFDQMVLLSDRLTTSLAKTNLGMFDGNEIGGGETILFLYGDDAEKLFEHILPVLQQYEFCRGARAVIRQGAPGAPQREVNL
jgi:hypothetical protein